VKPALAALSLAAFTLAACSRATIRDPFPEPIPLSEGVIEVDYEEFASIPDLDGIPARMMLILEQPGTGRFFVNEMRGPLYAVSHDGRKVGAYLDLNDPKWDLRIPQRGREKGFQSFAFHPQFAEPGAAGYGRFYTWTNTEDTTRAKDFDPGALQFHTSDLVLLEWTVRDPRAAIYDGGPPRELMRFFQPDNIHNGGRIAFNPLARLGDEDYGLLYMGVGDGGPWEDPFHQAQDLSKGHGKIFRIDPLGSNSANGRYGVPASNPFASDGDPSTLGEIWAYGLRNPQNFAWDSRTGRMFCTDIGQDTIEEVSLVTRGANLGWSKWEGSFPYGGREGVAKGPIRADPTVTYPVVEYSQFDPLLQSASSATGLVVYRDGPIAQLRDKLLFGDLPSGEIFWVSADELPQGGQSAMRRVLLNDHGHARTLLQVIQGRNAEQGKPRATRADLRLQPAPDGLVFVLNKNDGTIRRLVP
jgi:glucose/arabinose dehydrogenase